MEKTTDHPRPFATMMTDEEFQEFHEKKKKEQLLNDLMKASKRSFSVKNIKKRAEKDDRPALTGGSLGEPIDPLHSPPSIISDEEWAAILEKGSQFAPSPIDDITQSELGTFRLEDSIIEDPNSFDKMFKKEQSMLAELMKDVTEQARAANKKLRDMTKKAEGYASVSKTYPDLLSAANSLNTTRLSIVKQMADLKKTIADLNFKKAKEEGPDNNNRDDEIVNGFFDKILSNRKEFIDASMNGAFQNEAFQQSGGGIPYSQDTFDQPNDYPMGTEPVYDNNMYLEEEQPRRRSSRSITSSLMGYPGGYEEPETNGDPYGYIRNEDKDVSICVQRFQDGRVEFVAIDKDGCGVDDYELPGEDLLLTLEFRIGSQFATDSEGRRYRIIDVDPDGVDISDVLEDDE